MAKERKATRVILDTLGCKLNQAETELLAKQFTEAGYRLVSPTDETDVYILNTCTVTHIADRKSRHLLRLAHRRNPDALLIATGCYAQRAYQELVRIEGVNLVLNNVKKMHLPKLLEESGYLIHPACGQGNSISSLNAGFRTRAFIKVQDGCNNFCSYCIVPLVRNKEKSLSVDQVTDEVKHRIANNYKEVLLTGVKIGSYNHNGVNLIGLLEHILAKTDVVRLRLSSLQPQEISPEFLSLWDDNRLCCHFHLSLQSGCNTVLNRMRRCYSVNDYQETVSLIRTQVPEVAITTDVIVGFPGETDDEFEESYNFCQQMDFARIHIFSYSPREETQASQMPQQVEAKIKKQRSLEMLTLAEESTRNFSRRFLGKVILVLWEKQFDGVWSGLTDNYIKVYTRNSKDLTNKLLPVKLVEIRGDGVWGEGVAE
ncbi:tRNA (N(6)-L-threonylcarbamoyladenosine(37)-C(2))-methylthiotransferase MtaB [Chloroflexota bacterium]